MLNDFSIHKAENGTMFLTRTVVASEDDGTQVYIANTLTLDPQQQAKLSEWFRQEERAMLGSVHADGGASYETWLAERQAKVADDAMPATDAEYAEHMGFGEKRDGAS